MFKSETLEDKWKAVLESPDAPKFKDNSRKAITAVLLENQQKALNEEREQSNYLSEDNTVASGAIKTWDPVLISLVRRAMPNLIAYDVAGVQPLTMPTGLIFALKSRYQNAAGENAGEALYKKPDTAFSGPVTAAEGETLTGNSADTAGTAAGSGARTVAGGGFGNMGISIDKTTVTAQTRALKAEYTMEIAQDLKSVHGLDAEAELANILTAEIIGEINREIIDLVNVKATPGGVIGDLDGAGAGTAVGPLGSFDIDVDADGRWAVEKFKSLVFQLELEANAIAKATRRGKGNLVICSSNVASALAAAGVLDYTPALAANLQVDDTGNTFAGMINGRLKVFIDPYADEDYITVGYRGPTAYDAGLFYCPYVPLTMVRATDQDTFQPKIGFKTRYGLVANPFVMGAGTGGTGTDGANEYFRTFTVKNLGVAPS